MNVPAIPRNLAAAISAGPAAALTQQYQSLAVKKVPRIAMNNGRFKFISSTGAVALHPTMHLDVVIGRISDTGSRAWWAKPFDGQDAGPPDCYSVDAIRPSASAKAIPVVVAGGTQRPVQYCEECPKNKPGSFDGGITPRKACSWKRAAVVYSPGNVGNDPYLLSFGTLSWSGGKDHKPSPEGMPVRDYIAWLASAGANPGMVVTRLRFNPNQTVPALLASVATDSSGSALILSAEDQQRIVDAYSSSETLELLRIGVETSDPVDAAIDQPVAVSTPVTVSVSVPAPVPSPAPAPEPAPAPVEAPAVSKPDADIDLTPYLDVLRDKHPDVYEDAEAWINSVEPREVMYWLNEEFPEILMAVQQSQASAPGTVKPAKRPTARRRAAFEENTDIDELSKRLGLAEDI